MKENDIQIDGMRLHYRVEGPENGSPVVLMHGWGCSSATVASIASAISSDRLVYSLDLPGFGLSDEPKEVWGVEQYTEFVEKFIKQLGLKRPALIGHSFGGRISILLSSRGEVEKVVLVDAAGVKPKRSLKFRIKQRAFKIAKKTLPVVLGKETGGKIIDAWRKKAGSSDYNNASPMMKAILSKCVNEDLCDVMPSIKAPTLLLWGENDTATPLADAKKMESLIPDAGLVSWPGCGHYSFLENPGGFRAVIRNFLIK